MTTGKIIALTRWNFVDKVMFLLVNMPSSLVITFLPRSKHLLILWLQSPFAVILEPRKIKSATVSTSLVAQSIKHLSTMWETWVRSLGREDPLEKEMAIHSSKIPWTKEPTVHGVTKSRTRLSDFIFTFTVTTVSPSVCHEVMGLDAMIFFFLMLSFKATFSLSLSLSSRGSLVLLHFLP